ncbi:hypothetical protein OHV13_34465 [Kitasatospora purpeofusca]|uniref:hypothetical protein n=1 Tax=Kitasatospora purpeofusca TaxID=67352 RepID=UPI003244475A
MTDDEVARWQGAVAAYVSEAESAADELRLFLAEVRRRGRLGRLLVTRRWLAVRLGRAEELYAVRMAAAEHAYRPVLREVESYVVAMREERRAAGVRERDREEAKRLARVASLERWKKWWASVAQAADLRVWSWEYEGYTLYLVRHDVFRHGRAPLTARELAGILVVLARRGCTRVEWEEGVRRLVEDVVGPGMFSVWWRNVLSATVNTRAREAAEREIVSTAEHVGAALVKAGRPGLETFTVNYQDSVSGWHLALNWPQHLAQPRVDLPALPWASKYDRWRFGNYDGTVSRFDMLTLTVGWSPPNTVDFTQVQTVPVYYSHTRKRWDSQDAAWFAQMLLWDKVSHPGPGGFASGKDFTFSLAEHADAREFVPYVVALADMVTSALLDVACRHGAALPAAARSGSVESPGQGGKPDDLGGVDGRPGEPEVT